MSTWWLATAGALCVGVVIGRFRPEILRYRANWVLVGAVGAAALTAVFASGAPTGNGPVDLTYRVLLAVLVAYFGLTASSATLTILTGAVAALCLGGWPAIPAAVCFGAGLLRKSKSRRWHAWSAGASASVAIAIFRIPFSPTFGLSAALAALIGAAVASSGLRNGRKSVRRVGFAVGALSTGFAVVSLLAAIMAARQIRTLAEEAMRHSTTGLAAIEGNDLRAASVAFAASSTSFKTVQRVERSAGARLLDVIPVGAQHMRSIRGLSEMGLRLSGVAESSAKAVDVRKIKVSDGSVNLGALGQAIESVRSVQAELDTALTSLRSDVSPWLVPTYTRRVASAVDDLERARARTTGPVRASSLFLPALGGNEPRRYFLAIVTPSEMRGSGGLIGNFGEVTAENGTIKLARLGRNGDIAANAIEMPRPLVASDDYLRRWGPYVADQPGRWSNITMSPDFPSVAAVIEDLYPKYGNSPIDGVLSIDPTAMARLLKITGPIVADGIELSESNAERYLLHDQYVELSQGRRIQFLSLAATELWTRLTAAEAPLGELLDILGTSVAEKHIQMWFKRPYEQAVLRSFNIDSAVRPEDGDFGALVLNNGAGNKIDWYLKRSISYDAVVDEATSEVSATVEITLQNDAPATGLPDYVIGRAYPKPWDAGGNVALVSWYSPLALVSAELDGKPWVPLVDTEFGVNTYSAWVTIPAGGIVKLKLNLWSPTKRRDGYSLILWRQPQIGADRVTLNVRGNGKSSNTSWSVDSRLDLRRDFLLQRGVN